MTQLITYKKAKEEAKRLQHYVSLVESYQTDTLDRMIIKDYALTNSMKKTAENFKFLGATKEYIAMVIKGNPKEDELHKILKSGYMRKTRYSRSKQN
ncbi:hypothetical protein [Neobacillus soli]|uniref:hypothetical protein n=1 Tax=Neobacillus soli TaxID=220688 RepID=UPI000826DD4C|nr:hypothetical protein [Neobacillus soli]